MRICRRDNLDMILAARKKDPDGHYCKCGKVNDMADWVGWFYTTDMDSVKIYMCESCWKDFVQREQEEYDMAEPDYAVEEDPGRPEPAGAEGPGVNYF